MAAINGNRHWIQTLGWFAGMLVAFTLQAAEPTAPSAGTDSLNEKGAMCSDADGKKCPMKMCEQMKARHDKVAQELNLDEKQRKLFDDAMEKMHGSMKDGMALHKQMKELVHSEQYDEKQVRALVQKHNAEMEEKAVASANAMHAFHASLNAEQKEKFKALKDEMREQMTDHKKERRAERREERREGDATKPAPAEHDHAH